MTDHVLTEIDDHLGIITLDRPDKHHAMTLAMTAAIREAAAAFDADPEVWVILLRSTGDRSFCAGGDLHDLVPRAFAAGGDVMNPDPAVRFFSRVHTPIVCAIQGPALGGGFELVLGTDVRIAAEEATFGLPEAGFGLIAGSGSSILLPRQVGWARAMDLILGGDPIDAPAALEMGLITEVVPRRQVQERALERARRLTRNAPLAMRAAKEIAARGLDLEQGFVMEHGINADVIRSADAAVGYEALRNRTTPVFSHA